MTNDELARIAAEFDRRPTSFAPLSGAFSARLFLLDGREILRGRPLAFTSIARLEYETDLLDSARRHTSLELPRYVRTTTGAPGVCADDALWTLHSMIEGRPAGAWTELHVVDESVSRRLVGELRTLHDTTRGMLPEKLFRPFFLPEEVRNLVRELAPYLSPTTVDRCATAVRRIHECAASLRPGHAVFVHGDYHHGNVLVDGNGRVRGAIDLDDARYGHPFDDLGYTVAMMLRDYERFDPSFSLDRYRQMLEWYGEADLPWEFLPEYVIVYTLFDCQLFRNSRSEDAPELFRYQCEFLHELCASV